MSHRVLGGQWAVEVDLALHRPPTAQRTSRVTLQSCCAHHAELDAISAATQAHKAEMPVGSRIVDWPQDDDLSRRKP